MDSPVLIIRSHIRNEVISTIGYPTEDYSLSIDIGNGEITLFENITFPSSIIGFMYDAINVLNESSVSPYISDPNNVIRNFNKNNRSTSAKRLVEVLDQTETSSDDEDIDINVSSPMEAYDFSVTQADRI